MVFIVLRNVSIESKISELTNIDKLEFEMIHRHGSFTWFETLKSSLDLRLGN